MRNLGANVPSADLDLTHKFPWKWFLSDILAKEKTHGTVFSCFSCGGGSSMGYKLAGYDVIGNCEIDPRMMAVYKANLNPKYPYLMDVRDFLNQKSLPDELYSLDILDGSPPCSVFSKAGKREKGWNIEKVFREGQARQRLDDLFFWFIDIAEKLKPKIVIAENVAGLIQGNARGYVHEIIERYEKAGYLTQIFLLNSAVMGVPQKRERVFFISHRKELNYRKLVLDFKEQPIKFAEVRSETGVKPNPAVANILNHRNQYDVDLSDINKRMFGKNTGFTSPILHDDRVANTVIANGDVYRMCDGLRCSDQDIINIQTFPQDYDFGDEDVKYICGMSVPPVMMAHIADEVYKQWLRR